MSAPRPAAFATFWEAMENAQFNYAETHQFDGEHRMFARALEQIVDGDVSGALEQPKIAQAM